MSAQISDLTTATRLLTGALVELQDLAGGSKKLDIDTLLAGLVFDTTTQFVGFSSANTAEVEANVLAIRATLRPDDENVPPAGWTVGRYAWSSGNFINNALTTGATAQALHLVFAWVNTGGIAVIKKVNGSMATGAVSGTRNGVSQMNLLRAYGLGASLGAGANSVTSPASQGGSGLTGVSQASPALGTKFGNGGLLSNQPPSQARIQFLALSTTAQGYLDPNPVALIQGGAISAAGNTQFNNVSLYDHKNSDTPLLLMPGTGFQINVTLPAAGTSQTMQCFCNIQWDEWTPTSPGDR